MGSIPLPAQISTYFNSLKFFTGEILKRPTRADCKSAGFTFTGSNPVLPTVIFLFFAGVAQLVERQPSKLNVASSNLVSRSKNVCVISSVGRASDS